eukprot:6788137-Alexandrium_andersonii.AAC.1
MGRGGVASAGGRVLRERRGRQSDARWQGLVSLATLARPPLLPLGSSAVHGPGLHDEQIRQARFRKRSDLRAPPVQG